MFIETSRHIVATIPAFFSDAECSETGKQNSTLVMKRRNFLKSGSMLAASGFFSSTLPIVAGPFKQEEFSGSHFPFDKKLDPAWLATLYEPGSATVYKKSKNELQYIGMPVGGICAGGVYLGGDGILWLWDIFNQNQTGAIPKTLPIPLKDFNKETINNTDGTLYLEPSTQISPLQQGFAISVTQNGTTYIKKLKETDWAEISFEATYPVATITYSDPGFPVKVTLHAFSPFIPGNALESGLPATIQSITVKNISDDVVAMDILGWLENKMLCYTEKTEKDFNRANSTVKEDHLQGIHLHCSTGNEKLKQAPDFGDMFFGSLTSEATCIADVISGKEEEARRIKYLVNNNRNAQVGGIIQTYHLQPQKEINADFIISWFTPNICFDCLPEDLRPGNLKGMTVKGANAHFYSTQFKNAAEVAAYIAKHYDRLKSKTMLWKDTWYNSSLPYWFLERTFVNISTLATTTTHRFQSGRYYAWEGIGCCHGNCTHVYQYAQAVSRIFPELERDTRERVDLGIGYDEKEGMIRIRGEETGPSVDGQAGTLLRIYREHQMSRDDSFLKKNWPKIKKAVIFIMNLDKNNDGMEDTPMENTLDAKWHGEIAWIVGLCIAGVKAGQAMAEEMKDKAFARRCADYVSKGSRNMEAYLFNGEYFIHRADPKIGKKEIGSFNTCHIDQVYGQSWAWQVNLGRVLSKGKTMSALQALWKYNYMPDVGPYIKKHPGGRFYALAGDGGMVMNTNPRNEENPYGNAKAWQVGYFNECMSGFEHQVAAHMMAEGMIEESLVLTRSIHDRYHAYKRNPFNEIECSDHYGRAMASYGTFISACGFTYHGPKGQIGFAPKLKAEDFKAPFTAAEGWGTYSQQKTEKSFSAQLKVACGSLSIQQLTINLSDNHKADKVEVLIDEQFVPADFSQSGSQCVIVFKQRQAVAENQTLYITSV